MKKRILILVLLLLAALFLFKPAVEFIFKIKEPYFIVPVELRNPADIPIRNDDYGDGEFGAKRRGGRRHSGIDILAPVGMPVLASKSGWAACDDAARGYGKLVVIEHPGGYETRYGHLSEFKIRPRRWVSQGSAIGLVGKTGNADHPGILPHLHFEIRDGEGRAVDPMLYLERQKADDK